MAPAISRTFIAGMMAGGDEGRALVESYGGRAIAYVIDLRNPLAAGRRLTMAELESVYRYADPAEVREKIAGSVAHGLLAQEPDGSVAAGERGQAFLRDLFALHGRSLGRRWERNHATAIDRLNSLLARLLAEAASTGGAAWAVHAPPYEPAGTSPGVLLLNRLSTMRFHRADAHAAAWQAAGLTAAEVQTMPWGTDWTPGRWRIEDDTNRNAAPPYAVLDVNERLSLIADLAALP